MITAEQRYIAELIKQTPVKIAHKVGFDLLTELHNDWIKGFLFGKQDETLQAHRGSYKTTAVAVALALYIIIKPQDCILFMRKTENDIKEVMKTVSNLLKSDIYKIIAKVLHNKDLILLTDTHTEISTNLQATAKGTSQLTGLGTTSSLTGKHYEIIFTDDIVNLKDRVSKAERERIKLVYQELQNLKNRGGRIINIGTPWHKDDCFKLMPEAVRHNCYDTSLISDEEREDIRKKITPSLFAANYELKHISDEDLLFCNPQFTNDESLIENGICHIDASYGGEDTTAFTIIKQTKQGFIGFGKVWAKHVDNCLPEIYRLIDKYKAGTCYMESNADKGYLAKEISKAGKPVKSYHEKQNKYVKISTYLYGAWRDIQWLESSDDNYMNQILDFKEGQGPDDAPDSASCLIRLFDKKTNWQGARPI